MKKIKLMIEEGELQGFALGSSAEKLVIPDGVTSIANRAFCVNEELRQVVIPDTVVSIGNSAFDHCTHLEEVRIPENLTKFGWHVFEGTPWSRQFQDGFVIVNGILLSYTGQKKEVLFPGGIRHINQYALRGQKEIKRIILPEGVESIGEGAFSFCYRLEEAILPDSVKNIERNAFESCHLLKGIRLPSVPDEILWNAFMGCLSLERRPVGVYRGNVLFTFPEYLNGTVHISYLLRTRDYQNAETMICPEIMHDLIFQLHVLDFDPDGTEDYIRKHFPEMIPILIRMNDEILVQKLFHQFPELLLNFDNIMIQEANRQGKYQLQMLILNEKYQHGSFSKKDFTL